MRDFVGGFVVPDSHAPVVPFVLRDCWRGVEGAERYWMLGESDQPKYQLPWNSRF